MGTSIRRVCAKGKRREGEGRAGENRCSEAKGVRKTGWMAQHSGTVPTSSSMGKRAEARLEHCTEVPAMQDLKGDAFDTFQPAWAHQT